MTRVQRLRLGLLLAVLPLGLLLTAACQSAVSEEGPVAVDAEFRSFVHRYLDSPTAPGGPPQILVKDLPPGFDAPMPEEAVLVGSIAWEEGPVVVILDVPGMEPTETIDAFKGLLEEAGWRGLFSGERPGGVNPSSLPRSISLTACGPEDQWLNVSATKVESSDEAMTDVRITLATPGPFPTGCGRSVRRGAATSAGFPMPSLDPPEGAMEVDPRRLAFFSSSVSTSNALDTDLSRETISDHYAAQLRGQGWEEIGGGVSHEATWSYWRFEDRLGRPWLAVLTVGLAEADPETGAAPRVVVLEGLPLGHSLPDLVSLPR